MDLTRWISPARCQAQQDPARSIWIWRARSGALGCGHGPRAASWGRLHV